MNHKRNYLFLVSIFSLFLLSCSFINNDKGSIAVKFPDFKVRSTTSQVYEIGLQSTDGYIIKYAKTTQDSYTLDNINPGIYILTVVAPGTEIDFVDTIENITVTSGQTTVVDVELLPQKKDEGQINPEVNPNGEIKPDHDLVLSNDSIAKGVKVSLLDTKPKNTHHIEVYRKIDNLSGEYIPYIRISNMTLSSVSDPFVENGESYTYQVKYFDEKNNLLKLSSSNTISPTTGVGYGLKPNTQITFNKNITSFTQCPSFDSFESTFDAYFTYRIDYKDPTSGKKLEGTVNTANSNIPWINTYNLDNSLINKDLSFDSYECHVMKKDRSVEYRVYLSAKDLDKYSVKNSITIAKTMKLVFDPLEVKASANGNVITLPKDWTNNVNSQYFTIKRKVIFSDNSSVYESDYLNYTKEVGKDITTITDYFVDPSYKYTYKVTVSSADQVIGGTLESIEITPTGGIGDLIFTDNISTSYDPITGIQTMTPAQKYTKQIDDFNLQLKTDSIYASTTNISLGLNYCTRDMGVGTTIFDDDHDGIVDWKKAIENKGEPLDLGVVEVKATVDSHTTYHGWYYTDSDPRVKNKLAGVEKTITIPR